ncbi:MAG: hypothetical protein KDD55_12195 [Bdellovibrionales bacterium]|nr:hypothetical protein [Bdellovibrionales bacterium]
MSISPREQTRDHVRKALKQYGAFFASVAQRSEEGASSALNQISAIDSLAKQSLEDDQYSYYWNRRNYLMGLFYEQLVREVHGQVQEDLIREAKGLIDKLEIVQE